jgi:hypothetical protein
LDALLLVLVLSGLVENAGGFLENEKEFGGG